MDIGKALIAIGIVLVVAGLLWIAGARLGLGHLPGDFIIERENFRLFLPLGSCVVVSLALSLIIWLIGRL